MNPRVGMGLGRCMGLGGPYANSVYLSWHVHLPEERQTVAIGSTTLAGNVWQINSVCVPSTWPPPQVSQFLAGSIFKCMGEVFTNANNVKDWLSQCATSVARTGR